MQIQRSLNILFIGIFALGLFLRIVPLTFSHVWDETVYLQNAKVILDGRTNYSELDYRPPMLSIFYAVGFSLWDNVYVANIVQGLVSSLIIVFGFLFSRTVFGTSVAVVTALFFAFMPYLVSLSHELMADCPAIMLMMGAIFLFTRRNPHSLLFSGVFFSLAVLTRWSSMFLILYFFLYTLAFRTRISEIIAFAIGSSLTILPYLIWAHLHTGFFLYPIMHARRIIMEWSLYVEPLIFFQAIVEIFPVVMFVGLGAALVYLLTSAIKTIKVSPGRLMEKVEFLNVKVKHMVILLVWGILFFAYMLTVTHKETRYIIPIAIPVVILSAVGLVWIFETTAKKNVVVKAIVGGLLVCLTILQFYPSFQRLSAPWVDKTLRGSVPIPQYLKKIANEKDTIYATHEFPVLAFYSELKTVSLLEVQEDFYEKWQGHMKEPGYYVYYLSNEDRKLVPEKSFLNSKEQFLQMKEFKVVYENESDEAVIYRYVP